MPLLWLYYLLQHLQSQGQTHPLTSHPLVGTEGQGVLGFGAGKGTELPYRNYQLIPQVPFMPKATPMNMRLRQLLQEYNLPYTNEVAPYSTYPIPRPGAEA